MSVRIIVELTTDWQSVAALLLEYSRIVFPTTKSARFRRLVGDFFQKLGGNLLDGNLLDGDFFQKC